MRALGESIGIVMVSAQDAEARHGSGARGRQNLQARVDEVHGSGVDRMSQVRLPH
jgi:hypothetical protein